MVADAFTKALSEQQLVYLMMKCGFDIEMLNTNEISRDAAA